MKNTVTQEQIDKLWDSCQVDVRTVFGKTTVVTCKLVNGFRIVESSSCVDPANYDEDLGFEICKERIKNKLWELEGYVLQKELHAAKRNRIKEAEKDIMGVSVTPEEYKSEAMKNSDKNMHKMFDKQLIDYLNTPTPEVLLRKHIEDEKHRANKLAAEKFFKGEHFDEIAGANPVMIGGGSISATTIHASEIKGITTTPAGLLMMEEDDGCCVDEANGTQPGDIYQLTEALRALDKDYDNTARAKIIDKMLQVLGL